MACIHLKIEAQKSLGPILNSTYTVLLLPAKYYRQKISQQTAAATSYHAIIFRETALAEFGICQDLWMIQTVALPVVAASDVLDTQKSSF